LAQWTPWTPDAIEKMVRRGVLVRGVHYFQPFGRRGRLVFKWGAIVALIEGQSTRSEATPMVGKFRADETKRVLNVEEAETALRRLLD
jgi:hypothetical protein